MRLELNDNRLAQPRSRGVIMTSDIAGMSFSENQIEAETGRGNVRRV
jgi:hypothetical protein